MPQVLRSGGGRSLWSNIRLLHLVSIDQTKIINGYTYLGHSTIHNKVTAIDETALVTSQKHHGMSLLNSLSEPTSREVHLPPEALGLVVTQPILQKGSAATCE